MWLVYGGEVTGEVGTRSRMCYVGWVMWVQGVLLLYAIPLLLTKFFSFLNLKMANVKCRNM